MGKGAAFYLHESALLDILPVLVCDLVMTLSSNALEILSKASLGSDSHKQQNPCSRPLHGVLGIVQDSFHHIFQRELIRKLGVFSKTKADPICKSAREMLQWYRVILTKRG